MVWFIKNEQGWERQDSASLNSTILYLTVGLKMATLPVEEAIDNDSPALGSLRVFPPDSDPVEYPIAQGGVCLAS